jgi:Predicted membrane protein
MSFADAKQLVLDTLSAYSADHGERLAAALAYYATFSLAPLLVLALSVAGMLYGQRSEVAQEELMSLVETATGPDGAALLGGILESAAAAPDAGIWATILSGLVLIVGATALFARLQEALNTIWAATPRRTGVTRFLWSRGLSLLLVVGAGTAVVAGLMASSLLAGLARPLEVPGVLLWGERMGSLAVLTLLFAVLYRVLPDAPVRWADVWLGAVVAATLVTLGTWGLGVVPRPGLRHLLVRRGGRARGPPAVDLLLGPDLLSRRRTDNRVRPSLWPGTCPFRGPEAVHGGGVAGKGRAAPLLVVAGPPRMGCARHRAGALLSAVACPPDLPRRPSLLTPPILRRPDS